ncbi:response regulator transcription factor [Actinoplanes sp. NPDC051851]|uniref:response regulator transcription factor n=1 Tax=Actinoplanes sp. NPDC051851 TaxID=3154753 RepID=UPI00343894DB
MTASPPRILLVNDDPALIELVAGALHAEGWDTRGVRSARTALATARVFHPDIAVLDMLLPDLDGLSAMEQLRSHVPDLPVLFLTAVDGVDDLVRALSAGGDDYVTRPFSLPELVSRLRALLRRTRMATPSPSLTVGDLTLDEPNRRACRADRIIELTATEFDLLRYLMLNPGRVIPREQILQRVWRFHIEGHSRVVEIYISRLRRKLESGSTPLIHTVRGIGYIVEPRD